MEQIVITKADNTTWSLITKSAVSAVTKAVQKRALLGEDIIDMAVSSATSLQFNIGDRITVFGATYTLNSLPKPVKSGNRNHNYDLTWEGKQYDLLKAPYFAMGEDGISISPDWSLAGDLSTFIDILINNLNDHFGYGIWEKGTCPETAVQTLTFSVENCLGALQYLCKEEIFNKEFEITEADGVCTLNIKDAIGQNLSQTYRYGRGKGLYNLSRQTVSDKNIITKLFAFGSDKNLPSDYRGYNQRLKLPGNDKSYIEDATAIANYGKIAGSKVFDEIFPHRTGTVTSLGSSVYEFIDTAMDFDLKTVDGNGNTIYLLNQTSAKIHFNTGNLAGYEFEVLDYVHSTRKFTIKGFADDRGQVFPDPDSSAFQVASGDEYVIIDILMPQSYVTAAESELQATAESYLSQNSQPRVQYSLQLDETVLKALYPGETIVNVYGIGDYLTVQDTDINVNKAIRIKSFSRDLIYYYRYNLDLSDIKEPTTLQRIMASNIETEKILAINRLRDVARAKRNWKSIGELQDMIFDTDGYFDGTRIKPETIETMMAIIGIRSQALSLACTIEANYENDENVVNVTLGTLSHFGIEETPRDWAIAAEEVTLTDSGAYYIYAKCAKVGSAGIILFSQDKIMVNDDANYYHFLLGILSSVQNNARSIKLTYGYTVINGREIVTGRISSLDGLTYFDLDTGEIAGKIVFGAGSYGYDNLEDKPDLSGFDSTQTVIDGGLITTGRIEVGPGSFGAGNAWINGSHNPADPDNDYRFGAGASYANRADAPFWVKNNGAAVMKGIVEFGTLAATVGSILQNLAVKGPDLWENNYDNDGSAVHINRKGYNGGTTRFRDFVVYDGKGNKVLQLQGAAIPNFYIGTESHPANLYLNDSPLRAANNHQIAIGTDNITCPGSLSLVTDMSITMTPKGSKLLIIFSAPFYVSANNQTLTLYINVNSGSNVRVVTQYIIGGTQTISFHHLASVTPRVEIPISVLWLGTSSIQQRAANDGERVLTVVDLM